MENNEMIYPKKQAIEFMKTGQIDDALAILMPLSIEDPDDAELHTLLGTAYHKKGDKLHSIYHFEEAVRIDESPRSYFNLGMVYEHANRIDEAVRDFQVALSLDPSYIRAQQALNRLKEQHETQHPTE